MPNNLNDIIKNRNIKVPITKKYIKNKNVLPTSPPKGIFGKRNVTSPPLLIPLQRFSTTTKLLNTNNSCCNEVHKLGTIPKYLLKHKKLHLENNKNYIEYEQKFNSENNSSSCCDDTKMIQEVIEFCEFSKKVNHFYFNKRY